jgi:hypothetical protein
MDGKPIGPRRGVPRHVYGILRRGLSIDPTQRHHDMDALLSALEASTRRRGMGRSLVLVAGLAAAAVLGAINDHTAPVQPGSHEIAPAAAIDIMSPH